MSVGSRNEFTDNNGKAKNSMKNVIWNTCFVRTTNLEVARVKEMSDCE